MNFEKIISEKKAELAPLSRALNELMDEENKLWDVINEANERLKEIRSVVEDEKFKTNHRTKNKGLRSKVNDLKHEIKTFESINERSN